MSKRFPQDFAQMTGQIPINTKLMVADPLNGEETKYITAAQIPNSTIVVPDIRIELVEGSENTPAYPNQNLEAGKAPRLHAIYNKLSPYLMSLNPEIELCRNSRINSKVNPNNGYWKKGKKKWRTVKAVTLSDSLRPFPYFSLRNVDFVKAVDNNISTRLEFGNFKTPEDIAKTFYTYKGTIERPNAIRMTTRLRTSAAGPNHNGRGFNVQAMDNPPLNTYQNDLKGTIGARMRVRNPSFYSDNPVLVNNPAVMDISGTPRYLYGPVYLLKVSLKTLYDGSNDAIYEWGISPLGYA